jgi:hypothetical protein
MDLMRWIIRKPPEIKGKITVFKGIDELKKNKV